MGIRAQLINIPAAKSSIYIDIDDGKPPFSCSPNFGKRSISGYALFTYTFVTLAGKPAELVVSTL